MQFTTRISWPILAVFASLFAAITPGEAAVVNLQPVIDNSIIESDFVASCAIGNLYSGETRFAESRRALLAFDIAASIPAGSTINSAELRLTILRSGPFATPTDPYELHRLIASWGESSGAGASQCFGGNGAPAAPNDATWAHRFWPSTPWAMGGGDFAPAPSAITTAPVLGTVIWPTQPSLVADVQAWLDDPANNFGWIVVGDESLQTTAREFDSRDGASPPELVIDYTAPIACDDGLFCNGTETGDSVNGCVAGVPVICDDGVACTEDSCNEATDSCDYIPNNAACDDGLDCNGAETCSTSGCQAGVPVVCDDGVACTADSCVEATDSCAYAPNNAACDDGNVCTDDVCTATGCTYGNNTAPCDDGADCTTGDVCSGGVCAGNTSQPNPKTKGFYRKACKNNQLTEEEAQCVAQTAPQTFGDTDTVEEVCDELNGHDSELPGHDSDEKHCTKDETELLVAALNVCTGRVCESQPINSHDSDTSNDPDPATVGEAIDEADAIFGDPDRDKDTCREGRDLVKGINNGKALEMNTLRIDKVTGGGTRLTWTPPFIGEDQAVINYEVWRSVRGADAWVKIRTQASMTYLDQTSGEFEYEVVVEIQEE